MISRSFSHSARDTGGGGGGVDRGGGGGGGAGGFLTGTYSVVSGPYAITVGAAGIGRAGTSAQKGGDGGDSSAFSLTAIGHP